VLQTQRLSPSAECAAKRDRPATVIELLAPEAEQIEVVVMADNGIWSVL
jgi:hypothetical protein